MGWHEGAVRKGAKGRVEINIVMVLTSVANKYALGRKANRHIYE